MKSVNTEEYSVFCSQLKKTRGEKRQSEIAALLGVPQTYVSAYELGKVRLDFVQLRNWCAACGWTLAQFVEAFEQKWAEKKKELEEIEQFRATKQAAAQASSPPATVSPPQKPPAASTAGKTKPATGGKTATRKAPRR